MAWPMKVARNAPAMPRMVVRMKPLGLFGPGASQRAMRPAMKPTTMIHNKPPMLGRQPSVRRQMVDHLRQILAEAREQLVTRQAALGGQALDLVGAERIGEIAWSDRLVLALADPGIGSIAMTAVLKLVEEIAEPAAEHAAGRAAREQAAKAALQQVAEATTSACIHRRGEMRRRRCRGRLRRAAALVAAQMFECLPGEQAKQRHGHGRHAAAG